MGIRFLQSGNDFPLTVSLGEKAPVWGLSRWTGKGLRFLPPDDEGFTLRGDRRRLVYKGRRRSHRFTILGDTAFEYDCILEKEPESNVITLLMEGAENGSPTESYDFFRQPDFVKDPFLKGSYAVYKKETLIGEGTGKLCHIHRPQIIDSRGRRYWGNLSVVGNRLCITIPENFLSEAKYPVIVDPTIGTTTVGSQTTIYNDYMGVQHNLIFNYQIPVNRFLVPEKIHGACTATAYVHSSRKSTFERPVIYSDDAGRPLEKLTGSEEVIDFSGTSGTPPGWRSSAFSCDTPVEAGAYCWFGLFVQYWQTAYDYGGTLRAEVLGTTYYDLETIPGQYPQDNLPSSLYGNMLSILSELRLSMYFSYTVAQNHVRTLTQGVTLTESRKLIGAYKRSVTQTVRGTAALSRFAAFSRQCLETVCNAVTMKALPAFIRSVIEHVRAITEMNKGRGLTRNCTETVQAGSETKRSQGFYRKAYEGVRGTDVTSFPVLFLRSLPETVRLTDSKTQWAAYIRGLRTEAASRAETRHGGEYYRKQADRVQAAGIPFRNLLIFVRLVTTSLIRDFILRRFLKSNEEFVLKSPVCREIILDSTIH